MFAGGTNWKLFAFGLAIIALVGFLVVSFPNLIENYAGARIEAWLDKDFDPTGARWQTNNSLYAIGSGGFSEQAWAIQSKNIFMFQNRKMTSFFNCV